MDTIFRVTWCEWLDTDSQWTTQVEDFDSHAKATEAVSNLQLGKTRDIMTVPVVEILCSGDTAGSALRAVLRAQSRNVTEG